MSAFRFIVDKSDSRLRVFDDVDSSKPETRGIQGNTLKYPPHLPPLLSGNAEHCSSISTSLVRRRTFSDCSSSRIIRSYAVQCITALVRSRMLVPSRNLGGGTFRDQHFGPVLPIFVSLVVRIDGSLLAAAAPPACGTISATRRQLCTSTGSESTYRSGRGIDI